MSANSASWFATTALLLACGPTFAADVDQEVRAATHAICGQPDLYVSVAALCMDPPTQEQFARYLRLGHWAVDATMVRDRADLAERVRGSLSRLVIDLTLHCREGTPSCVQAYLALKSQEFADLARDAEAAAPATAVVSATARKPERKTSVSPAPVSAGPAPRGSLSNWVLPAGTLLALLGAVLVRRRAQAQPRSLPRPTPRPLVSSPPAAAPVAFTRADESVLLAAAAPPVVAVQVREALRVLRWRPFPGDISGPIEASGRHKLGDFGVVVLLRPMGAASTRVEIRCRPPAAADGPSFELRVISKLIETLLTRQGPVPYS